MTLQPPEPTRKVYFFRRLAIFVVAAAAAIGLSIYVHGFNYVMSSAFAKNWVGLAAVGGAWVVLLSIWEWAAAALQRRKAK